MATGLWPLVHRRSFEAVTGRKTYWWLVNTVGSLLETPRGERSRWVETHRDPKG